MDERTQRIFCLELHQQCRSGVLAAVVINEGCTKRDQDIIWFGVNALLGAAANVSKILWPGKDGERTELIELLKIDRTSPLAERSLRNDLEHIDSRIEEWARSGENRNYAHSTVAVAGAVVGLAEQDMFRQFDPSTTIFTFRGRATVLNDIIAALQDLDTKLGYPPV